MSSVNIGQTLFIVWIRFDFARLTSLIKICEIRIIKAIENMKI